MNAVRSASPLLRSVVFVAMATLAGGCDLSLALGEGEGTEIGPRGGVVASDDERVTLEVPGGALSDTVAIRIVETDNLPEHAIGPAYSIEPFGLGFSAPAELLYDVSGGMMDDPEAVRLVTQREHGWDVLADHAIDVERNEVSASVLFAADIGIVE